MADNNPLTIQNATTAAYQFEVGFGGDMYNMEVMGGESWNVPATFPCDQWVSVTVSDSAESQMFQVLNAKQLIWDANTLGCLAGVCGGGCKVSENP